MIYKAVASHRPPWWAIEVTEGLPDHMFAHTQVRRLTSVDQTAREVIAALTEVDPDEVDVEITIRMSAALADAYAALTEAEQIARNTARDARRQRVRAARMARDEGLTTRESALLFGVSHQRISQLINEQSV
jgi:hypothetical protein